MWEWLFGRRRGETKRDRDSSETGQSDRQPGADASLGATVNQMKAKGYQGPFANLCDGIMAVTFHGPGVSLEPRWIEPDHSPFQMRILNCDAFSQDSLIFALGEGAAAVGARFMQARTAAEDDCPRGSIPDARKIPCLLSYPRGKERIPDGPHFLADVMEDLWNIFLLDEHLSFTRSWTGQVVYRAKLRFRPGAMFVTEVEASRTRPENDIYRHAEDESFAVRQVDFLIKTLLYRLLAPAPLPRGLHENKSALYALMEYGRWGRFPTFEDTTEHRLCLNGTKGRFPHKGENALLPFIEAVEASDSPIHREKLLEAMRGRDLYFAFSIPEEGRRQGGITPNTPVEFFQHVRDGGPCTFAYTDPALRIEPSHGCLNLGTEGIWELVSKQNERSCLVLNPGGPATCVLTPDELRFLAR